MPQVFDTPITSPDIETDVRFQYPALLTDNGVRAIVNVLIIGGKDRPPFGILEVDSRKPRQFTEDDTIFLRGYANLLAGRARAVNNLEAPGAPSGIGPSATSTLRAP